MDQQSTFSIDRTIAFWPKHPHPTAQRPRRAADPARAERGMAERSTTVTVSLPSGRWETVSVPQRLG